MPRVVAQLLLLSCTSWVYKFKWLVFINIVALVKMSLLPSFVFNNIVGLSVIFNSPFFPRAGPTTVR